MLRALLLQQQLVDWEAERRKLDTWREKTYDTDKITGTMQRFKVDFIRNALAHQMIKFHANLKYLQQQSYNLTTQLHDLNRQRRNKKRELIPLESGIQRRTLEERRTRFNNNKMRRHLAAARIQGLVRGRQMRRKLRLGQLTPGEVPSLQQEVTAWAESYDWNAYNEQYGQYYDPTVTDATWSQTQQPYEWDNAASNWYYGDQYYGDYYSNYNYGAAYGATGYAEQTAEVTNAQGDAIGEVLSLEDAGSATGAATGAIRATSALSAVTVGTGGTPVAASGDGGWSVGVSDASAITTSEHVVTDEADDGTLYPTSLDHSKRRREEIRAQKKEKAMLDFVPQFSRRRLHDAGGPRLEESCVPRDPDTGMPTVDIPRLLRHKLATLDREAFPYSDRRTHIAFLRKVLAEQDWLRVAGIADQIIARQRETKEVKDQERKADEAKREAERVRREELRRQEECVGMLVADKESSKLGEIYAQLMEQERVRKEKAEKARVTRERKDITREDERSMRVEVEYRVWAAEQARLKALEIEKENRKRERKDMTDAARESREWSTYWNVEAVERAEYNRRVGEVENEAMEEEEELNIMMNRIWRRIGQAADYTRRIKREKAAKAAAGIVPAIPEPHAPHEDEVTAEREAIKEILRAKGLLEDSEDDERKSTSRTQGVDEDDFVDAQGDGDGDGDDEDMYEGEVAKGNNGWRSFATEDGYLYYSNDVTGVTQWDKPADF